MVRVDLRSPELGARFGQPEKFAVVPMPEATVHEDDGPVLG
jgi:hypothetical protein